MIADQASSPSSSCTHGECGHSYEHGAGVSALADPVPKSFDKLERRHNSLRKMFGLPSNEQYLDEFHCAFKRRRVLLQGRLYVFDRHLCFHSRLFGKRTDVVEHLDNVQCVTKEHHVGFPNSIEVQLRSGERLFFTSFLSRNEAHRLVQLTRQAHDPTLLLDVEVASQSGDLGDEGDRSSRASVSSWTAMDLASPNGSLKERCADAAWPVISTPPPECPTQGSDAWTKVLDADFASGTLEAFCAMLESSHDEFLMRWHEKCGHTNINYSSWVLESGMGRVRNLTFCANLKKSGALGGLAPDTAECTTTQKGAMHAWDGHLAFVLQGEQSSPRLPYGEDFWVETCWVATSSGATATAPGLHLAVHVRVVFRKRLMFAAIIRKESLRRSMNSFASFKADLLKHFSPAGEGGEAPDPETAALSTALSAVKGKIPSRWRGDVDVFQSQGVDTQVQHRSHLLSLLEPPDRQSWIIAAAASVLVVALAFVLDGPSARQYDNMCHRL